MADDWRTLYPFDSRYHALGEHQLHYLDEGQGETLLLVHGNPTWSFYWRELISAFRGDRRVVAVDHMGCGLSDKPQQYSYCLAQHIENLLSLIQDLDLRNITLVVHDWGGAIGLGAAVREPERFSRLVILNTAAFPPPYVPWRIRLCRTPVLGRIGLRGLNLFSRAALFMAMQQPDRLTPEARAGLLAPYDSWAHRVAVWRFVQDIPRRPSDPTWQVLADIESQLPQLAHLPVQLIWGMRDWCFTPVCLEKFQTIFPQAETHALDNVGHYVMEEAPQNVIGLLWPFLENLKEPPPQNNDQPPG